jgi:hypothetical protein
LMTLLRYAAWLTRQQPAVALAAPKLTLPILAAAYDKRLAKHVRRPVNPFLPPDTATAAALGATASPPRARTHPARQPDAETQEARP